MPIFTVTVEGNGTSKTVYVNTETMEASVAQTQAQSQSQTQAQEQTAGTSASQGGKRSAPSFRLKKRRITRKLKKTR